MSKDIRSFFTRKDPSANGKQNNSSPVSSKKRPLRVIESDSEDDDLIFGRPAQKKQKEGKCQTKTPEEKRPKSKDNPVSVSSYFGDSPVQQKQQKIKKVDVTPTEEKHSSSKGKSKKKRKDKSPNDSLTMENDDGFDETLMQIEFSGLGDSTKKEPSPERSRPETAAPKKDLKKTPDKRPDIPDRAPHTPGSADGKRGKSSALEGSGQKRKNAESYQRYLNRSGPKNPGSKEIPKGRPNCLHGLTFVISGVLDSMEREEAVELIQRCGGRVTGSISGKTDYIVVGEEAGASKLEKAKKMGTKKLSEDGLLDMIRSKSKVDDESGSSQDNFIEGTPKKESSEYFKNNGKTKAGDDESSPENIRKKMRKIVHIEPPKFKTEKYKIIEDVKSSSGYETESQSSAPAVESESSQEISSSNSGPVEEVLWVDKYKPKNTKQIIGQGGDKSNVKKLAHWLQNWFKNHGRSSGKKAGRPAPWSSSSQDGSAFKAALLSGSPGVGKTTSVHLVCKELGFDIVEFNASDTRSKRLLQEGVSELLSTKSIRGFFNDSDSTSSKHVLVMDEVDGMAGNEDRGGIQELIQVIKHTKIPVICMCNDRSHPKIRSLVNYCFDLRFSKPRMEQIKGAMMSVCFKEGVKISSEALEDIITNANNDVRQVLHNLSLWAMRDKSLSVDLAKKESAKAKKPLNLGPWDVARKVFSASDHSSMSFRDKEELFFQDYSLGPLFVQDTYLRVKPHAAKNDKKKTLNLLSKAADSILIGDVVERAIRRENAWGLLPVQAIFSSVIPGQVMEGHVQGQIQFPVWLGKNSKRNRFDRMLQELQMHMRLSISGSKEAVNLDYSHLLKDFITSPLEKYGADGVADSLRIMSDYNLTKEDLENMMELTLWPGKKDVYASLDSKVKAALTRAYNKEGRAVPFATGVGVKKKKATDNEYGEEMDEDEESPGNEDDLELDAMIKKGKAKSKPETKQDGNVKGKKDDGKGKGKKEKSQDAKRERKKK